MPVLPPVCEQDSRSCGGWISLRRWAWL